MTGSGLGTAFEKIPVAFPADVETTFLVCQRMREISQREYLDFVDRLFGSGKTGEY